MAKNWIPPMNSPARRETDSLLEDLEKRINKEYEQAAKEMQTRADKYFKAFEKQDAELLKKVNDGKMTQEAYDKWRASTLMQGERYKTMIADLTNTAVNADKAAMAMVNNSLPETFAINANYATYEVEHATNIDTNFTLYNRDTVTRLLREQPDLLPKPKVNIPLDKRWNAQHITSALTQGILQGDSILDISKRLRSVTDMDGNAAVRNARTMTTGAENAGKKQSYERARDMGIEGQNMWIATHDNLTRESHAAMDGELCNLGEKFSNGCEYPGDPNGDPSEIYNCRCSMVFVSKYSRFSNDYAEQNKSLKIDGMSYEEWKNRHEEAGHKESTVYGTNRNGQEIIWSDKANSPKWEEPKKIIRDLSEEFETKLEKVDIGSQKSAGSVQISGTRMFLSSNSPSTVFHEFAHTISMENQTKFGLYEEKDFWKDISKVQRDYKKAVQDDPKKWISTYEHSSKGHDEFFAEAFTQAMLLDNDYDLPDKYGRDDTFSKKVLDIVKKYFGKK